MATQVTFADKVENNGATPEGQVSAADMNEIKAALNANAQEADAVKTKTDNLTVTQPVDLDFVSDQTEFNTFVVRDGEVIQDKIDELTFGQVLVIGPNPNTAYAGFSFSSNINNITVQGMHNWNGSSYPSVISGPVSITGTGIRFRLQNLQVNGGLTIGNGGNNFITECYFGDDSDLSAQTGITQLWRCTFNGNITGSVLALFLECNCTLTSQLPTTAFTGSTFFVNQTASYHYYDGSQWVDTGYSSWQESSKARKGEVVYGTTAERPSSPSQYYVYYDTDESKAVIWNGSSWVDFTNGGGNGSGVTTAYAWNPLAASETGTDGAYISFDAIPTGFLEDGSDWSFAVRLGPTSSINSNLNTLFATDVSGGGVSIQGDTYWGVMSTSGYLKTQSPSVSITGNQWLVFSFDSSAGTFDAWVGSTKTNDGTFATFASSTPTTMVFGQEAAGYDSAYFYQLQHLVTDIMIMSGQTLTDADAAEFLPNVSGVSSLSSGLQAKVSDAVTFTASGASVDKGSLGLTFSSGGDGSHSFTNTVLPDDEAPSDIVLSSSSVLEGTASGFAVGSLTAIDSWGGSMTFSLVSGTGDTDNSSFTIVGNELRTAATVTSGSKSIRIRVTDSGSNTFEKVFSITVTTPVLSEDWESGLNGWSVANGGTNDWHVGTADANNGTQAAYISNDSGVSVDYSNTTQVSHIYKTFTASSDSMNLNFSWKCNGEGSYDHLIVSVIPDADTPSAGTLLSGAFSVNGSYYGGTSFFVQTTQSIDGLISSGNDYKLVFTWKNDGSGGSGPAVIDDISIS